MRRLLLAIFLALALALPQGIYARTFDVIFDKASPEQVIKVLKKETGLDFMYQKNVIDSAEGPVTGSYAGVTLEELLSSVISGSMLLSYKIVDNTVVLSRPAATDVVKGIISGVVTDDEENEPLPGASVVIRGTRLATVTDAAGRFQFSGVSVLRPVVTVSFIGMETESKAVRPENRTSLNFRLKPQTSQMEDVVVIGYGTAKAKDLTGSVTRIGSREVERSPMTANIAGMLQGKAAGVNVMIGSASPTSPVSVIIRGQSSLSGDGQPLWVIDGVPQYSSSVSGDVSNTLYNLNLNDVSSIDILKDASATAIYGSRAANGVVIVTTKTGSEGMKPQIEFSSRLGWQAIDSNGFRSMNAEQYKEFSKRANLLEAFRNGGLTYFNRKYIDDKKFRTLNTSQWDMSDISDMWLPNAYYDGNDDWWGYMTQNALTQDFNVALRGGSKTTSYYASLNYKDQDGVVKGSYSKFFGVRFNFETMVSGKIKFGLSVDASTRRADSKDQLISKILGIRPDYPMFNPDGSVNTIDFYTKNPILELRDKNHNDSKNFTGIAFLEYNFLPYMKFRTTLNTFYSNVTTDRFTRVSYDGDTNRGSVSNSRNYVLVWDNLLTFYKAMGIHDVQAMVGQSMERQSYSFLSASGSGYPDDDVLTDLGSASRRESIANGKQDSAMLSVFARMQYKLLNRYLLTATFRADASSRFGKDSRWGYFPSAALGWIISNEKFMQGLSPAVSYLKLRASYGKTGSQNLGYYNFISSIGSNVYNGKPGAYPSSLGNSLLQWESQNQTDIGIDYGFLDDRIRGSLGWYRKYVDNLITSRPVPTSSSFSSASQNVGAISNTGLEFDITVSLLRRRGMTWEVNFNAARNKGRLEKLNGISRFLGGGANQTYKLEEGSELGTFYGYVDAGRLYLNAEEVFAGMPVDPTTGQPKDYRTTPWGLSAGDVYLVDLDGDGKITADGDRKVLGNANPDVFGGFGSTFIWKGLMVNATFTYSLGGKRYWESQASKFGGVNAYNAPVFMLDSYTVKGDGATLPVATHYGMGSNNVFSNRWLHDASYLRMSALNVSYRFPKNWFRDFLIKGIEATFQATNLFTVTKYPGMDPQGNFSPPSALYGTGTDNSQYPAARTYSIALKFTIN